MSRKWIAFWEAATVGTGVVQDGCAGVGVTVCVTNSVCSTAAVLVHVGEATGPAVGTVEGVKVAVGWGVKVGEDDGVSVGDGDGLGVTDGVELAVAVAVGVLEGVREGVGVLVLSLGREVLAAGTVGKLVSVGVWLGIGTVGLGAGVAALGELSAMAPASPGLPHPVRVWAASTKSRGIRLRKTTLPVDLTDRLRSWQSWHP
jgi:hypothetical protein